MSNLIIQGYGAKAKPLTQGYGTPTTVINKPLKWYPGLIKPQVRSSRPFRGK